MQVKARMLTEDVPGSQLLSEITEGRKLKMRPGLDFSKLLTGGWMAPEISPVILLTAAMPGIFR